MKRNLLKKKLLNIKGQLDILMEEIAQVGNTFIISEDDPLFNDVRKALAKGEISSALSDAIERNAVEYKDMDQVLIKEKFKDALKFNIEQQSGFSWGRAFKTGAAITFFSTLFTMMDAGMPPEVFLVVMTVVFCSMLLYGYLTKEKYEGEKDLEKKKQYLAESFLNTVKLKTKELVNKVRNTKINSIKDIFILIWDLIKLFFYETAKSSMWILDQLLKPFTNSKYNKVMARFFFSIVIGICSYAAANFIIV